MLSVASFDPYSLAVFIDYGLVSQALPPELVSIACDAGMKPSADTLTAVRAITDSELRGRAITIAAAIWHEKRHFFDYVLTGYGANVVRGALTRTMYTEVILGMFAAAKQEIVVPTDTYGNTATRAVLDAAPAPPQIAGLLAHFAKARRRLVQHTVSVPTKHGPMQLSGLTALESLGFYAETHAVLSLFGLADYRAYFADLTATNALNLRYRWADYTAGPRHPVSVGTETFEGLDVTGTVAAIVAALGSTTDVAGTFITINEALGRRDLLRFGVSAADAWRAVNEIMREATGATVMEGLHADFEREAAAFKTIPDFVRKTIGDLPERFHRLRGRLIAMLERTPHFVLDMDEWTQNVLPLVQPHYVLVYPDGLPHAAIPPGMTPIWNAGFANVTWSWALGVDPYEPAFALAPDAQTIAVGSFPQWSGLVDQIVPLAKLFAAGRRQDVVFGPELDRTEALVRESTPLRFDPAFAQPVAWGNDETRLYFHLRRATSLSCHRCGGAAVLADAVLLAPWDWRRRFPLPPDALPEAVFTRFRDWTPKLVCAKCYREPLLSVSPSTRSSIETSLSALPP